MLEIIGKDFNTWLRTHPCSVNELWKLQNCLGTLFGYDSKSAVQARNAWEQAARSEHVRTIWKPPRSRKHDPEDVLHEVFGRCFGCK